MAENLFYDKEDCFALWYKQTEEEIEKKQVFSLHIVITNRFMSIFKNAVIYGV